MTLDHDPESLGLTNNKTQSTLGDDTCHIVTVHVETINVFFDGTGNNYFNTAATPPEQRAKHKSSYGNDLTNVARMWQELNQTEDVTAVYIEGIGTIQEKPDSLQGNITGTGETGVVERVHGAFQKIQKKYKDKHLDETGLPAIFNVNVFGFSRGSAAARYFVHLLNTQKNMYFTGKWQKPIMRVNFVGLFDCVAHYGWVQFNDTKNLHLDFEPKYAMKVFHLVAGDEYRANFNLTNIQSALDLTVETCNGLRPMGRELKIPGAHSDVGGSYNRIEAEWHDFGALTPLASRNSDPTPRMEIEGGGYSLKSEIHRRHWPTVEDWALNNGWYTRGDCSANTSRRVYQRQVTGESYQIALTLMVEEANRHLLDPFPVTLTQAPADPLLKKLHGELRAFAQDEKNSEWKVEKKWDQRESQSLRREHLHLSFNNKTGMSPGLDTEGLPKRTVQPG